MANSEPEKLIYFSQSSLRNKNEVRQKLAPWFPGWSKLSGHYNEHDIFRLLLAALRENDFEIAEKKKYRNGIRLYLDHDKIKEWITKRLDPNTLTIGIEELDLLQLLVFSLVMPYKMFAGETLATVSEKSRRSKQRDFVQIFSDTFIGKIGEIAFKKFAREKLSQNITLDWTISRDRSSFKSDLVNSRKVVSIKSTDTLESIWAEAPVGADYGILVKVAMPKDFLLRILAEISSLRKLLEFVENKLEDNQEAMEMIKTIQDYAFAEKFLVKAFIGGYFQTGKESTLRKSGEEIPYLGTLEGERHFITSKLLRYSEKDWKDFFKEVF